MGLCKKKKALSEEEFEGEYGRHWIWTALDPESKLIISLFVGQRTLQDCELFIKDLVARIRTKPLFTSDELPHYQTALAKYFSHLEDQPKTGKRGRPRKPKMVIDPELQYATVHKTRDNGRVVNVERKVIFGDPKIIDQIIESSATSNSINTSFIERANLTLRNHNRKLTRKTLCFAKRKEALKAQTNIVITYYNFSKSHGGLTLRSPNGSRVKRTPAMAANLVEGIWPLDEILTYPMR